MRQLTQILKSGSLQIVEVPIPLLGPGQVLVRNYYSVISIGTEASTVRAARKGYLGKAKERPEQFKQVIDTLREKGPIQTYRSVMKKLESHSPLGYSCVGRAIEVAPDVMGVEAGDLVACGGAAACHAEVVCVPKNLCVKIENDTDLKQSAYNSLGAIALQGIRQADLHLGETCAVIGLGLLGQITGALLRAAGIRVLGFDINQKTIDTASEHCTDFAFHNDETGLIEKVHELTYGHGCDAVIITAASRSLHPINFSGAISRKRATIVIVGSVPTGFDREPHFYRKELTVKMSCSYGPGRYDPEYEDKGHDYPLSYVRWTQQRNMEAFQKLIAAGKMDLSFLTTHCLPISKAPEAYDMILERSEAFLGILIEYDATKELTASRVGISSNTYRSGRRPPLVGIGFIGAGSYAQSYLLPNIPKGKDVVLKGVMTSTSTTSRSVAERFGFDFCTCNARDILDDEQINTVFIATRHDSHSKYVLESLRAGKHVFVEKPLCLNLQDLEEIASFYDSRANTAGSTVPCLMVGFNRRFSPLTQKLVERIGRGTMSVCYRINAGPVPRDSWVQDIKIGGGRILGEVCHYFDYLTFVTDSRPISIYGTTMYDPQGLNDTVTFLMKFHNGSIATVQYLANGSKSLAKEYLEVHSHGVTAVLKNYVELEIYGSGRPFRRRLLCQDKGNKNEVHSFIRSIKEGLPVPIPVHETLVSTMVTLSAVESIKNGNVIHLSYRFGDYPTTVDNPHGDSSRG